MAREKTTEIIPYFYVTPREYSDQTGMWVEDVKRLVREGKLDGEYNKDTGYYKVKVYRNEAVSRAEYEQTLKELIKYKTIVETIILTTKTIEN